MYGRRLSADLCIENLPSCTPWFLECDAVSGRHHLHADIRLLGAWNDRCTFTTCNPGYNISTGSTQANSVTCEADNTWTANRRTCKDRNECTEGVHTCRSATECINSDGSFFCTCPSWVLPSTNSTLRCAAVNTTSSSVTVFGNAADATFTGARITISQWRVDKTVADVLSGYPKNVTGRPFNHTLSNLEAGLRFKVYVEFIRTTGMNSAWNYEMGTSAGTVNTTCGCSTEITGSPTGFSASQVLIIVGWDEVPAIMSDCPKLPLVASHPPLIVPRLPSIKD